jgi:hypothetical protein
MKSDHPDLCSYDFAPGNARTLVCGYATNHRVFLDPTRAETLRRMLRLRILHGAAFEEAQRIAAALEIGSDAVAEDCGRGSDSLSSSPPPAVRGSA